VPPDALPASQAILVGEDAAQYHRLLDDIMRSVRPVDIVEQFWVRDVADLLWEALRLRRLKGNLLHIAMRDGLQRVLAPLLQASADAVIRRWYEGDEKVQDEIEAILRQAGLSFDSVLSEALSSRLDAIERIDRMVASAEARRNAVLREISRHRDALAVRLTEVSDTMFEAEFGQASNDDQAPVNRGKRG
jgi:hypothetical protein